MFVIAAYVDGKFKGLCHYHRPIARADRDSVQAIADDWTASLPINSNIEYRVGRVIFDEAQ